MKCLSAALAALLAAAGVAVAAAPVVPGEPALSSKAVAFPELRLPGESAAQIRLPPVSLEEIEAVRSRNALGNAEQPQPRRLAVGLARPAGAAALGAGQLAWVPVAGGEAARVAVTSPDAGSLRVALDLAGVPPEVEMAFFGSADPARVEGPVRVGEIADRTVPWLSPLTEGDTQTVEFFVPAPGVGARLALRLAGASHLFTTPSSRFTKRLQDIGSSGACNVDVPCSALASDAAFRNAANSVAQMVFSDAGFTYLCTGTLLADADTATQTPWFYSANHCFENENAPYKTAAQMQAVANTLATLWGFEANACRSGTVLATWKQLGGGATFVFNGLAADVLFLRLNAAPPTGAYFSGWDANPLGVGSAIATIHHPQGDLKKVSQGTMLRFGIPGVAGGSASFVEARYSSGSTEPGSSGAGIWSSSGGAYSFRGGLWGGSAACSNPGGTDYFSRFDQAYPSLAAWLGSTSVPTVDYTDLWWNPNESGWGLNLVQHASRVIFGVWYTYGIDGARTWYVMPTGSWTSANTYTGPLYVSAGPPYTAPFDPAQVEVRQVGSATLSFSGANNGTFTYSVDGVSGIKSITRQPF